MGKLKFTEILEEFNACKDKEEMSSWAKNKTWQEFYNNCPKGQWFLRLFKRTNPDNLKKLTLAKGHCAATILSHMKDERSKKAVEVAIKFGNDEATIVELNDAYIDADEAADETFTHWKTFDNPKDVDSKNAIKARIDYNSAAAAANAVSVGDFGVAAIAAAAHALTDFTAIFKNENLTAVKCREYLPIEIWNII